MPSPNDPRVVQLQRTVMVRAATHTSQFIAAHCKICGRLTGLEASSIGALDHARLLAGHVVTAQTLQSVTYAPRKPS